MKEEEEKRKKLLKIPKKLPRVALMGRNRRDERVQKEEEEVKEKAEEGNEEEASSETEEEKSFNDVNYWKTEIIPDDNIMSAILNDLD